MKFILSIVSFCLFSLSAFSQVPSEPTNPTKNVNDSVFDITAQAGFDYRMATYQLSLMYWINPTNQIGLKAGANKSDGEHQTVFSLQYKHFLKNTFYISPEIYYLNTRERDSWWLTDSMF
jgi:hypothetical protein